MQELVSVLLHLLTHTGGLLLFFLGGLLMAYLGWASGQPTVIALGVLLLVAGIVSLLRQRS